MKINKDTYMLAKAVYKNFFIKPEQGTDCGTIEDFIYWQDPQSGNGEKLGKLQIAILKRCARIIREYEAQNISHRISSDTIISIDPATGEGVIMQRINPTCNNELQKAVISQPTIKYVGDIKNLKK